MEMARLQLAEVEASKYAVSLCYALLHGSLVVSLTCATTRPPATIWIVEWRMRPDMAFNIWRAMATCVRTRHHLYTGRPVDLVVNRDALAEVRESGFPAAIPELFDQLRRGALVRQGDARGGLACIEEGMVRTQENGQVVGMPEMLRIKGNVLLGDPDATEGAVECFRQSIELARRDARFWELRSAISLVNSWRRHGGDRAA